MQCVHTSADQESDSPPEGSGHSQTLRDKLVDKALARVPSVGCAHLFVSLQHRPQGGDLLAFGAQQGLQLEDLFH